MTEQEFSRNREQKQKHTPQVIYQLVPRSDASDLPKLKLTEFSGDPLEWPEWSSLFDVVVLQKINQRSRKDAMLKDQSNGSSKSSNIGNGVQL